MKNLSVMIKPASSLCNLRCKYCFYSDVSSHRQIPSYGMMTPETTKKILENIYSDLEPGDQIRFAFQGGEPTLAGIEYFRNFVEIVSGWKKNIKVAYALQTNGILLDEQWCDFLREHHFLVGISLDILPKCHNSVRVTQSQEGTYQSVIETLARLRKHRVEYNVLCTLTKEIARYPQKVWNQIRLLDLDYVQFIPCFGELDAREKSCYAITPKRFASFYNQMFSLWLAEFQQGRYRSIKLFDDVVNYIASGVPGSCGMDGCCQMQIVVEADGSVFPCDFYCTDMYQLGNLSAQSLAEIMASPRIQIFKNSNNVIPAACKSCPFLQICHGNCKRMRQEICCENDGDYCGYRTFLETNMNYLYAIAMQERQYHGNRSFM